MSGVDVPVSNFSVADLLVLARLSSAAYLLDDKAAVAELGMELVCQVGSLQCQATVARWGQFSVVALRGTQVAQHLSIPELFDDIENDVVDLPGNMRVHRGFWEPLVDLWSQIEAAGLTGQPLLTGHSLGGVRAQLAKYLCPAAEVVSFGAPQGADDAFWRSAYPAYSPVHVVHEKDFAPGFPPDGPWISPAQPTWLHAGTIQQIVKRPGLNLSISDHSIDNGYIPALAALVAKGSSATIFSLPAANPSHPVS